MQYPSPSHYTIVDLVLWLLRRRKRFRVVGNSMLPTLKEGNEVFVDLTAYRTVSPKVGDIVLAQHPLQPDLKILKRVTAVSSQNTFFLSGDNPAESSDSRDYGAVSRRYIVGRVSSIFI